MRKIVLGLGLAAALTSAGAEAKWTEVPAGAQATVAAGPLRVTPGRGWNANSSKPIKNAESWSLDGPALNELTFFAGIGSGGTLARARSKKYEPLPQIKASMLPTDIAQVYEQTLRILTKTPDFTVESIEPASFAGQRGFRFSFRYTRPDDELTRRGEARGAMIGGKLYMIAFTAAALHYFDAGLPLATAIMDSARLN